jgi:hypothetical protein
MKTSDNIDNRVRVFMAEILSLNDRAKASQGPRHPSVKQNAAHRASDASAFTGFQRAAPDFRNVFANCHSVDGRRRL